MVPKRVIVTGASGLLGRAVLTAFKCSEWTVLGTALTRTGENLVKVDLCDFEKTEEIVESFKPSCIVHCAAQRFPDKVDKDIEGTVKLNVEATKNLSILASKIGATMIYISTDYVFDGTKPPYVESDEPNPLNTYGKTKLEGEKATLETSQDHIVLRVPILYGPVEYIGESAVTTLLQLFFDTNKKSVSDTEIRYPSHVDDIASVCVDLAELKLKDSNVKGIFHWGGKESMTKYHMVQTIAEIFSLSMEHITRDTQPSQGALRPHNAQLSNAKLESIHIGKHTPFCKGIKSALTAWVQRYQSGNFKE